MYRPVHFMSIRKPVLLLLLLLAAACCSCTVSLFFFFLFRFRAILFSFCRWHAYADSTAVAQHPVVGASSMISHFCSRFRTFRASLSAYCCRIRGERAFHEVV